MTRLYRIKKPLIVLAFLTFVTKENFAFAYTWSGEALEKMHTVSPNLRFLVHPKLSHWSKDLLTFISDRSVSVSGANELAGIKHLNKQAIDTYYFSPNEQTTEAQLYRIDD